MRFSACPVSKVALYIGVSNWNWNSAWANVVPYIIFLYLRSVPALFVSSVMSGSKEKESHSMQSFYGHKSRCFDVSFLECAIGASNGNPYGDGGRMNMFLSASEDGSAKLWDVSKKKVLHSFSHSRSYEVLRASFVVQDYVIATCASDGSVIIWIKQMNGKYHRKHILNHDGGQIYACETRSSAYSIVEGTATSASISNSYSAQALTSTHPNHPFGVDTAPY